MDDNPVLHGKLLWVRSNKRGVSLITVQFKPQDMWIGVFWQSKKNKITLTRKTHVFVCLVPMLPIIVTVVRFGPPVVWDLQQDEAEKVYAAMLRSERGTS